MSEPVERVPVACPACSPEVETVHEVLSDGGGALTVRCADCGHTHKAEIGDRRTERRDVVVSQDGESFATSAEPPVDEELAVGEEFVVDTEEALMTVRITSLEVGDARTQVARARDIDTIWTRAVDNVAVPVTINPTGRDRDETRSVDVMVPGDDEFVVGETYAFADERFTVKHVKIREDAYDHGYEFAKLDHAGDAALAKDVQRLYADDETSDAWSAW